MSYAFNDLGFDKMIFANAVGNQASRRIKEKTGCRLIAVEPASFVDPSYTEHEIWELSKKDWQTLRANQTSLMHESCGDKDVN